MQWSQEDPGVGSMGGVNAFAAGCDAMAARISVVATALSVAAHRAVAGQDSIAIRAWEQSIQPRQRTLQLLEGVARGWASAARTYAASVTSIAHRAHLADQHLDAARRTQWLLESNPMAAMQDPSYHLKLSHAEDQERDARWALHRLAREREQADAAFVAALRNHPGAVSAHAFIAALLSWVRNGLMSIGNAFLLEFLFDLWRGNAAQGVGADAWLSLGLGQDPDSDGWHAEARSDVDFTWFGGLMNGYLAARAEANADADADADVTFEDGILHAFAEARAHADASAGVDWGSEWFDGWVKTDGSLEANASADAYAYADFTGGLGGGSTNVGLGAEAEASIDLQNSVNLGNGLFGQTSTVSGNAYAGAYAEMTSETSWTQVDQQVRFGAEAYVGVEARQDFSVGPLNFGGGASYNVGVGASASGGTKFGWEEVGFNLDLGFAIGGGGGGDVYLNISPKEVVGGLVDSGKNLVSSIGSLF